MDDLKVILGNGVVWEVSHVERDDSLGIGFHGCRDYMPITGVRELDRLDQRFVPRDDAVGNGFAHQLAHADEAIFLEIGPTGPQGMKTLVEDVLCPSNADRAPNGEPDQQVSRGSGVEDVGIDDNGVCHELLVSQFVFLSHLCELSGSHATGFVPLLPVTRQLGEVDPSVSTNLLEGDLALFEQ